MKFSKETLFIQAMFLILSVLSSCNEENIVNQKQTSGVTDSSGSISAEISDSTFTPLKDSADEIILANNDFRIVPGKSIGKIHIGMSQETMLKILGKPDSTDAAMGTYVYTWMGKTKPYRTELNIVTRFADSGMKKRIVKMIRTTSQNFLTENGAGTQKYLYELKELFPGLRWIKTYQSVNHNAKTDLYSDETAGILFECLNYEKKLCVALQIFEPEKFTGLEF